MVELWEEKSKLLRSTLPRSWAAEAPSPFGGGEEEEVNPDGEIIIRSGSGADGEAVDEVEEEDEDEVVAVADDVPWFTDVFWW